METLSLYKSIAYLIFLNLMSLGKHPPKVLSKIDQTNTIIWVTNNNDNGPGSLRDAIQIANETEGPNTIRFNLEEEDYTIFLATPLPNIEDDETHIFHELDSSKGEKAYIILEGRRVKREKANGLHFVGANNCSVEGLIIQRFPQSGIKTSMSENIRIGAQPTGKSNSPSSNIIRANGRSFGLASGISLDQSPNFQISNNEIDDNHFTGIYIQRSGENLSSQIDYNIITKNTSGIYFFNNSNTDITNNHFMDNNKMTLIETDNGDLTEILERVRNSAIAIGRNCININIQNNTIENHRNSAVGIYRGSYKNYISQNILSCNAYGDTLVKGVIDFIHSSANLGIQAPLIQFATEKNIIGLARPYDSIEIYLDTHSRDTLLGEECKNARCQGDELIATTRANKDGRWRIEANKEGPFFPLGQYVTALAFDDSFNTSPYAECVKIKLEETVCDYGGRYITQGYEYKGTLNNESIFPTALNLSSPVLINFGENIPESAASDIYIISKLDNDSLSIELESSTMNAKAYVFDCECEYIPEIDQRFCNQTYRGISDSISIKNLDPDFYYIIVVDDTEGGEVEYTLRVNPPTECIEPDIVLSCNDSISISDLESSDNSYDRLFGGENKIYERYQGENTLTGKDTTFKLRIEKDAFYNFEFIAYDKLSFILFDVICGRSIISHREFQNKNPNGQTWRIDSLELVPGDYTIVIDSESEVTDSRYTLNISCDTINDDLRNGLILTKQPFKRETDQDRSNLRDNLNLRSVSVNNTSCEPDTRSTARMLVEINKDILGTVIDRIPITIDDQIYAEYLAKDSTYLMSNIRRWSINTFSIPFYADQTPNDASLNCGFNSEDIVHLRMHRINQEGRIYALIGTYSPNNPNPLNQNFSETGAFKRGAFSRLMKVVENDTIKVQSVSVDKSEIEISADGGSANIYISSPLDWEIKIDEQDNWIQLDKEPQSNFTTLKFNIDAHKDFKKRVGFIHIDLENDGRKSVKVT